jgi:hypothetical protein
MASDDVQVKLNIPAHVIWWKLQTTMSESSYQTRSQIVVDDGAMHKDHVAEKFPMQDNFLPIDGVL